MGQKRGMVKLFGKTIEVVEGDGGGEYKILWSGTQGRDRESTGSEERGRRRGPTDDRSPSSSGHRSSTAKASKFDCNVKEEDRDGDDVDSNDRTLKKPEKILPCPRCNSEDTKFCYFNNYNVNQPRYFCRNCQRYWTAGGSMRKIPVGAGRRKNKSSAAAAINCLHVTITPASSTGLRSSSVQSLIPYQANGVAGGSVTSIGGGRNIADGDEKSCGSSSITASNSVEDGIGVQGYGYPIGGTPWIYPWNHNQTPPSNLLANTLFPATPTPPSPLGFAVHSSWNPQQQQQPWLISSQFSQPKSPLGKKHSRDGCILNHGNNIKINSTKDGETKCLWIPNTMRIEDLSEVAKSSMWLSMGTEKWKDNGFSKGGALFKPIKPKQKALDASDLLHPNPAALSRSQCFHEST